DGGDPIAVEGVGDHGRRRGGDCGQGLLDLRLERRAPEGEPLAAYLRQLGEDETFADRAARQLAHVQKRLGAVGERLLRLPGGQLVDGQKAAAVRVLEDV